MKYISFALIALAASSSAFAVCHTTRYGSICDYGGGNVCQYYADSGARICNNQKGTNEDAQSNVADENFDNQEESLSVQSATQGACCMVASCRLPIPPCHYPSSPHQGEE